MTLPDKWEFMLRLQGDQDEQLRWLAAHVGRLHEQVDQLRQKVATMRAMITRAKKKKRKKGE